jgi:hypothetical protein
VLTHGKQRPQLQCTSDLGLCNAHTIGTMLILNRDFSKNCDTIIRKGRERVCVCVCVCEDGVKCKRAKLSSVTVTG